MQTLTIDPEFESLIPALAADEYQQLEANILQDGCRDALVVSEIDELLVVVDGHNRKRICEDHGLTYNTTHKGFESREDAIIWICQNQRGRRNITGEQKDYLMGKEYDAERKKWGGDRKPKPETQVLKPGKPTSYIVSERHGVGHDTVEKNSQYARGVDKIAEASPAAKQKILSGQAGLTKTEVREIRKKPAEEVREIAKRIESGEYKRPAAKPKSANNATIAEATQKLNEIMAPRGLPTPDKVANDNGEILAININCFAEGISPYLDGTRSLLGISEITKEKIIASALQAIEAMTLLKEMCERGIKQ